MAEYTENLNLELPEHFEYFKLAVWNGNSAKIDEFAGTVNAHMENMNNPHQVTAEQIGAASDASVTAMQADVAFAKSQVEEITAYEKYITFGLIDGEYVELNGTITSYAGWKRSDYLEIPEDAATLRFDTGSSTYNDKYNCFYDENKNFISAFTIHKGDSETVTIPEAAKFVIFSGNNNFILQLRVSYESHGIGGVRENLGLPFTLKVMSYNVGMWSNGVSEGVPAEDVEQKAVEWHRFLGNLGVSAIYGFETATSFVLAAYKTNGNVPGRNTPWQGVIVFTKDNDGNTVIVSPKTFINTESSSVTPELNQKFNVGMFYVDGLAVLPGDIAANYTIFSVTTLVPFPVYTTDDSVAYTPDVFYCPTYEWEEYGKKVDINGVTYLIFGPWLIRDEEAAT